MSSGVIVAGAGPAGRALVHRLARAGVPVTLVDPSPDRVWRSTFACWSDELPEWVEQSAVAARTARIGIAGRELEEVARGYTVFDTPGLQRSLTLDGVPTRSARVVEIDGARVHLDDGSVLTGDAVVDCRGALPHDAPRQTAYGIVVDAEVAAPVLDGHEALLMDWRGGATDRRALPSFLYVVPLGGGEYLLEETCLAGHGSFAEASAGKLYAAQAAMEVALEAVQVFGGNGYMAEFEVEQLARDAKVLQIYAGTDEIQVSAVARSLLAG